MTYFSTIEDYSVPDMRVDDWYWYENEEDDRG